MPKAADIHLYIYLNPKQTEPNSCAAFNLLWSQLSVSKQNAIVAKAEATLVVSLFITFHFGNPKHFYWQHVVCVMQSTP